MALPSYEEYLGQFNKQRSEQDAYFQSIGFVRQGNNYVRNPAWQLPADQAKDALSLQKGMSDLETAPLDKRLKEIQLQKAERDLNATSAGPKLSATERVSLSSADVARQKIEEIERLIGDVSGGKRGNAKADTGGTVLLRNFLQKMGVRTPLNNETVDLNAKLSELSAEYAKVLSGVAISDKEYEKRLKPFLPQSTDTKQQIARKLANLRNSIDAKKKSIADQAKQTNLSQGDEIDTFLNSIGQ